MSVHAVLAAGGQGKRFKGKKQFFLINRRPLLTYSLDVLEKNHRVKSIVLVVHHDDLASSEKIIRQFKYRKIADIIPGGIRRQDSVRLGFNGLKKRSGIVVIHDAVRPFITPQMVNAGIDLCAKYQCVTPGIPISDTIKLSSRNRVIRTVPRRGLYQIQTPQFFDIGLLALAYEMVKWSDEFTDEASIIEAYGAPVYVMPGSRANIKITDRIDLEMARRLMNSP